MTIHPTGFTMPEMRRAFYHEARRGNDVFAAFFSLIDTADLDCRINLRSSDIDAADMALEALPDAFQAVFEALTHSIDSAKDNGK